MGVPKAWNALQTSTSAGTGSFTLAAATGARFNLADRIAGGAQTVGYVISFDAASQFEFGYALFSDSVPGTLTRSDAGVVGGTAGAGVRVPFAAGTKNVYLFSAPGQVEVESFSASATATLAQLGNLLVFTGSSSAALALPDSATVPIGAGWEVQHRGSNGAVLTLDPAGAQTLNGEPTVPIFQNESCRIARGTSSNWHATGLATGFVPVQTVDIAGPVPFRTLALPLGIEEFELSLRGVTIDTAGAALNLQTSSDGGVTYPNGASDFRYVYHTTDGAAGSVTVSTMGGGIILARGVGTAAPVDGRYQLFQGAVSPGRRFRCLGQTVYLNSASVQEELASVAGRRLDTVAITHISVVAPFANLLGGSLQLRAMRP